MPHLPAVNLDQPTDPRPGEDLPADRLGAYLREHVPELPGELTGVRQFRGGHANLTYALTVGGREVVLRRPPRGRIAPGTHDMQREYRVLRALAPHFAPAPRAYHYCGDGDVLGAPFVLLELRRGVVARRTVPKAFAATPDAATRLTRSLVAAAADLHALDPARLDLPADFGRPAGYLERQVRGAAKRWALAADPDDDGAVPRTLEALARDIPAPQRVSVVHNDVKPDNCQWQPGDPDRVTALFDWDQATLGDPLLDVGNTLAYWPDPRLPRELIATVSLRGDWPDKAYVRDAYAERSGLDLARLPWYESLALIRTAVIAQQLYRRYADGQGGDARMAGFGQAARALGALAGARAREAT